MVNKIKKYSIILVAFTFLLIAFTTNVYASSISMGPSATLNIGGSTSISITGSDVTGRFNISSSNSGVVSLSSGSVWIENSSATVTATAKSAGTATITLTPGDVANGAGDDITGSIGSKAITITVKSPQTTTSNTTTSNTTTTTSTKSSNANLKKLVPNYEGLSPNFNPSTTKYSLIVPESATSLGLTVAVEATGAKYWINGEDNLQMGDNTVTVTVTATDNTKKVYTIIVTRAADVTKANANLSSIVIDGKTLSPEFTAENLAYDIGTVTADVEKLTVLAYAQNEGSKIEITGNDKLVEGENTIKVKVTAVDGTTTKEYTIKVTKEASATKEVSIYPETNSLQDTTPSKFSNFVNSLWMYLKSFWLVLSLLFVCLFELAQIIYLYIKVDKIKKLNPSSVENNDKLYIEEDKTLQTRRRNVELENVNNQSWRTDIKKEDSINKTSDEKIDDIFDELVDNSEKSKIDDEDNTDNFEDYIDTDEDK